MRVLTPFNANTNQTVEHVVSGHEANIVYSSISLLLSIMLRVFTPSHLRVSTISYYHITYPITLKEGRMWVLFFFFIIIIKYIVSAPCSLIKTSIYDIILLFAVSNSYHSHHNSFIYILINYFNICDPINKFIFITLNVYIIRR